jgi:hypothetical protein
MTFLHQALTIGRANTAALLGSALLRVMRSGEMEGMPAELKLARSAVGSNSYLAIEPREGGRKTQKYRVRGESVEGADTAIPKRLGQGCAQARRGVRGGGDKV